MSARTRPDPELVAIYCVLKYCIRHILWRQNRRTKPIQRHTHTAIQRDQGIEKIKPEIEKKGFKIPWHACALLFIHNLMLILDILLKICLNQIFMCVALQSNRIDLLSCVFSLLPWRFFHITFDRSEIQSNALSIEIAIGFTFLCLWLCLRHIVSSRFINQTDRIIW